MKALHAAPLTSAVVVMACMPNTHVSLLSAAGHQEVISLRP